VADACLSRPSESRRHFSIVALVGNAMIRDDLSGPVWAGTWRLGCVGGGARRIRDRIVALANRT
jgi:hypothetical protein